MKFWEWSIPAVFAEQLAVLQKQNHPLIDDIKALQYNESGRSPQAFEIQDNIFLWRNYGYRIIYERMPEQNLLLLSDLKRMT